MPAPPVSGARQTAGRDGVEGFFARLGRAPRRLLMLDYDGTLAPFHPDPAQALPYPGVLPLLDALVDREHTRLIVVSGRWTRDLLPLLPLRRRPEIWGCHGWERLWPDNRYSLAPIAEPALQALVALDELGDRVRALGGRCEQKPRSVAFHWRGLTRSQSEAIRCFVRERWALLGWTGTMELHEFDSGIEFRVPGRNKGDVVKTLLDEAGSEAVAAYLGDDLTDEDAFLAIAGHGLPVLVRPEPRATAAAHRLNPPHELLAFLEKWRAA